MEESRDIKFLPEIYFWLPMKVKVLVTRSCLTLCKPMDCSPTGSSVRGILQARIAEWVAMRISRDLPDPGMKTQGWNPGLPHCRQILYCLSYPKPGTCLYSCASKAQMPHPVFALNFSESYCQSPNVVSLQMNPCGNGWWAMIFVLAILILGDLCLYVGEGNGNPLLYSCLRNPMDRGAWQAIVHEVAKSRTCCCCC